MQVVRLAAPFAVAVAVALALALALGCAASSKPVAQSPAKKEGPHVILVSIDGLAPDAYLHPDAHGLAVPTLRTIVAKGASSDGVMSVFPTVTYSAHTSMVTGVVPGKHGIVTNRTFDPLDTDMDGWRWYTQDIAREPIWRVAEKAGLTTATIWWPVTVGARPTWLVPEYWRAKNEGDKKLVRALSTPGLLDDVAKEHPDFWTRFTPPETKDSAVMDIALHVLASKPNLMLLHMAQVDDQQHDHGLWSKEANAAIENVDRELARLLEGVEKLEPDARLMIVSDHGFVNVTSAVKPCVLLSEAGIVTTGSQWKAALANSGGSAYVYVQDPADTATREKVRAIFEAKAKDPASGIARVYTPEQIVELGGDPHAVLALEASLGVHFSSKCSGAYADKSSNAAVHGYDPRRPELQASMLFFGNGVLHGSIRGARLVDVAPTLASWLGISMGEVDGQVRFAEILSR